MTLPELLAPAGDYDILVTAVNAGADAVYISGERFGARAFAKNFTLEEIEKSVEYAHLNGVKIHVTVNTLINNFEVVDVVQYLFKLYKLGVDAVIVQDVGIIELIKTLIPGLEVHASTQMTLSDYDCILWAVENGISRIVFPREISVDKIREISEKLKSSNLNMELEVFGHGALCYCFSGNCYISSYNSGRSGNRGACAQPCRKQYKLKYKNYNVGNGFLLSTHDLAVYKGLDKIEEAGVFSLKLEGRMKSADYVGTIVNAYRHIIDGDEGDYEKDLHLVFNREFTDGYILNQSPGQVLGRESSGHEGVYIGKIIEKKGEQIKISKENKDFSINLDIGDGIGFKYKDKIKGIYIDNIKEQTDDYIILNTTRNVREGDKVLLSYSKSTHDKLKKFHNETIKQHIPLSLDIYWNEDLSLNVTGRFQIEEKGINNKNIIERFNFNYISETKFEKALNRPISKEDIEKQMLKTGDSSFYIKEMNIHGMPENTFIPIGKLNKIRRRLLEKATNLLLDYYKPSKKEVRATNKKVNQFIKEYKTYSDIDLRKEKLNLSIFVDSLELLEMTRKLPIHKYYFDPSFSFNSPEEYFEKIKDLLKEAYSIVGNSNNPNNKSKSNEDERLVLVLSSFISDEEIEKLSKIIDELKEEGISIPIMYDTPGIGKSFNTDIYGNHNLNIWNSYNVKNLSESGFKSLILSSELSHKEIKELVSKYQYIKGDKETDLNIIIQGNLEVMSSKDDFSNLNDGKDFIINSADDYAILEDKKRKKFKYKVVFDYNKHSHFINKDCLCLIEEVELIKDTGVDSVIIDTRFSSAKYSSTIISLYLQALKEDNTYDLSLLKDQIRNITLSRLNQGNFINGRLHEKDC
ncbi:peptidase U32 family [Methanobrevibacter ruminantium M1]|uniref:Peptidase U32 family n=1 Tax=Methanobrevibacter ruminantium (strain ATCC 35063 / DSM 1093 / JCM 13430 / OCM 146 / M1) TaxID=634498 RepID=D3E1M5_METRM|nr:U32 family peptidase [Methanobrevibacter ruminantium]ADC46436.1 peptidase U32 family [Methanobrevibacter ruminantium M1]